MARTLVTARYSFPALHHWPNAPQGRHYLSHPHRHQFVCDATVEVTHGDREVEFHDLAADIAEWARQFRTVHRDLSNVGGQSCEHLARSLFDWLAIGLPVVRVSVSEDGEFTSTVEA
mgnify:CR=1 FL=1